MHVSLTQPNESASDEQLMAKAQGNDPVAFTELHRRHSLAMRGLTRRLCGGGALAEDAFQEAVLAIWRYRGTYRSGRGAVRTWMLSIAHNRTIDLLRKDRRHQRAMGDDGDLLDQQVAPQLTDAQAMARVEARTIRQGLKALPPEQAASIALSYIGGLTNAEIGHLADVPVGTVKGRIRLGLTKLRADPELAQQAA